MTTNLTPELQSQIEQEAESRTARLNDNNDFQGGIIQGNKDGYEAGAEKYALKWQEAEQRAERYEKALKDIAMQKTCEETEADEDIPIGSDGKRMGDIEMGYDCCIETAREALTPKQTTDDTVNR